MNTMIFQTLEERMSPKYSAINLKIDAYDYTKNKLKKSLKKRIS